MPLAVVPTPIGNLEDVTLRALRCLREADLIACEDTRRTGRLLAHYDIKNDLVAYHERNEARLAPELAERARTQKIALVSDAGTPLVSDPGYRLLSACIEAGVEIEALPGPSAPITALVVSGLPADTVVFSGFVPRKGRERTELLARIAEEPSTFVLFESPHRLLKTLAALPANTPVAVCRELTKLHEEVFRGSAEEAARRFTGGAKGEVVLVVRGGAGAETPDLDSAVEKARGYVAGGEGPSRAAARAARESGRRKAEIYARMVAQSPAERSGT
ncbi:MAG TPA: 16S rRNA (cytidine(1402)-2'-O)-methyltransferase [Rubrobacteraceae bacterium]|nr:16S rRNA (cytidine(1402)-2'-O)-methyltransferase [Rubrobacteraceae bacterium]